MKRGELVGAALIVGWALGCGGPEPDPEPRPRPEPREEQPPARANPPAEPAPTPARRDPQPEPQTDTTPAPSPSARAGTGRDVIWVGGAPVQVGAEIVRGWRDPGGFDGYRARCFFSQDELPSNPADGCATAERYGPRRNLPEDVAAEVEAEGWTQERLGRVVDQLVLHYDAAWTSKNCFRVLHDQRGLSCHFLVDVDGTIYQTLDVSERARHAGSANDRSIGVEIAHPGPLELTDGLEDRYREDDDGVVFDLGRLADDVRTRGFVVRPRRDAPVRGSIHGRTLRQYDYTEEQYASLARLVAALHRALPELRVQVPTDAEGRLRTDTLSAAELARYQGLLGHYHVSAHKSDPGPAFDWARLLASSQELLRGR